MSKMEKTPAATDYNMSYGSITTTVRVSRRAGPIVAARALDVCVYVCMYVRGGSLSQSPHLRSEEADRIFRQWQDVEHEVHSVSLLSDDSLQRRPGRGTLRTRQVDEDIHLCCTATPETRKSHSDVLVDRFSEMGEYFCEVVSCPCSNLLFFVRVASSQKAPWSPCLERQHIYGGRSIPTPPSSG